MTRTSAVAKDKVQHLDPLPAVVPQSAMTPMGMLEKAITSNASVEVMEKLMGLQERWEANQARKAFDNAMSDAKAEIPIIVKNRQVGFESKGGGRGTSYKHEDMAEIARTIDPIIAAHGLSYRFRTTSEASRVIVTCVVSHRDGHSEENSLSSGHDGTGGKNAIQGLGSALTYLQRYSLKAAFGLAASADDDGILSTEAEPRVAVPRAPVPSPNGKRAPFALATVDRKFPEWADEYIGYIMLAANLGEIQKWDNLNGAALDAINGQMPALYLAIDAAVAKRMADLGTPTEKPAKSAVPSPAKDDPISSGTPPKAKRDGVPDIETEYDGWFSWALDKITHFDDGGACETFFNDEVEAFRDKVFPSDMNDLALALERSHERIKAESSD